MKTRIFIWLLMAGIFLYPPVSAQENPPGTDIARRDTLIPLEETNLLERLADRYTRDSIEPNKKGWVIRPSSTFGVGYRIRRTRHNEKPFGSQHSLTANYNINRGAFFIEYRNIFHQVSGQWDLEMNLRADLINVMNFYGIGNETIKVTDDDYYQFRSREWFGSAGLSRDFDSLHFLDIRTFFQSIKIMPDANRFITDILAGRTKDDFERSNFLGISIGYRQEEKNNLIIPVRGYEWGLQAAYTINLNSSEDGFARLTSFYSRYIPLNPAFTFASRIGGSFVFGDPEFYQLNTLGGSENLRGFRRQRFYGHGSLFSNNEVRWLTATSKKLFQQIGLLAFFDAGRVWQRNEASGLIHAGYGGGLIIIPFNRIVLNASYGFSGEDRLMHLNVGYLF